MIIDTEDYSVVKAIVKELDESIGFLNNELISPQTVMDHGAMAYLAGKIAAFKEVRAFIEQEEERLKKEDR